MKAKFATSKNAPCFCLLNARSLVNKWDEIVDHIHEHRIDVTCITETWLSDVDNQLQPLQGYSSLHVLRPHRRGGGIAIIYRDCFKTQKEPIPSVKCFELLEVVLTIRSTHVRLVALYRPPPSKRNGLTKSQFFTEFREYLHSLSTSSGILVIVGDFNFHWDNPSHTDTVNMKDILEEYGLCQHINEQTHTSGHTLDWVITRSSDNIVNSSEVSSLISDHHAVHFTLNLEKPPLPTKHISYRCYKNINLDVIKQDLNESVLIKFPANSLDELLQQYNDTIVDIIDKHCPVKMKTVTVRPFTPWFSEEINNAKKLRRKLEKHWRKTKLVVHREMYVTQRQHVSKLIADAKTAYYTKEVIDCKKDQKSLFRVINNILGKGKALTLPSHSSLNEVLQKFSVYFTSKIANIRRELDKQMTTQLRDTTRPTVLPVQVSPPAVKFVTFEHVTIEEITKIISASPTKSCRLDPLPTWLLKLLLDTLTPAITTIINLSLQNSHFPAGMKKALVTPLLKKTSLDKEVLKNYRPVSNLSFLSKVTEKAAMSQIATHVHENNLLSPVQSAYRPSHSTETALLKVQNDILRFLDSSQGVILILLDLSAAFDTIDHDILVSRLQTRMGIQGAAVDWIKSYLSNRYQCISVDGVTSEPTLLAFGVPQGSVSGPQDFSYYSGEVSDIAQLHDVQVHLFADDTQLYVPYDLHSPQSVQNAVTKIQDCISDIRVWMMENKLKLNEDKTELLVITPSRSQNKVFIDKISIGDSDITPSKVARNLGIIFDDTMTMKDHVTAKVKSCHVQLRTIGKLRKYLSFEAAETLVHAFITSRLDNGNSLLYGLPDTQIQRLQRVQNTAVRILTRTRKFDHISPILKDLHWLPVTNRIKFKILTLTYKCLHNLAPTYLSDMIELHTPPRDLRSANSLNLKVPLTRLKTYGDRAFSRAAPDLWNSLPLDIKCASSLATFKLELKTYLFNRSF